MILTQNRGDYDEQYVEDYVQDDEEDVNISYLRQR